MNSPATTHIPAPSDSPEATLSVGELKVKNGYRENLTHGIDLVVCPGVEISWSSFRKATPERSIALDGLVGEEPKFDEQGIRANFNHHQNVNRLATRSTCGQVHMAIKSGLIESFRVNGEVEMSLYVNDPDQDSCLSVWLLNNHQRITGVRSEPLINKLVLAEDFIDAAAGGFPFDPKSSMMQELAWVFDPYVQARMTGRIRSMEGPEMANVIASVCRRIDRYTLGSSDQQPLDTRFEIIGGGDQWKMVVELGFYARSALLTSGTDAFVSYLGEENGRHHYSLVRRSPFITSFPLQELYLALNYAERLDMSSGICWNGGDTAGGSPRRVGSSFAPKELESRIKQFLERREAQFGTSH